MSPSIKEPAQGKRHIIEIAWREIQHVDAVEIRHGLECITLNVALSPSAATHWSATACVSASSTQSAYALPILVGCACMHAWSSRGGAAGDRWACLCPNTPDGFGLRAEHRVICPAITNHRWRSQTEEARGREASERCIA